MKKSLFETFIKKYTLNGSVETVKLVINNADKYIEVFGISDTRTLISNVKLSEFTDLTSAEIGIYESSKLIHMLKVLGEDITVSINKNDDDTKIISLLFADDTSEVKFVTADLDVIPKAGIKTLPDFNIEIELNEAFISKFIKAKNALNDVESFTILMNKKKNKLELAIGHGKTNTNKITLDVVTKPGKDIIVEPISFNAQHLKDIIVSNDHEESVLKISEAGLAAITFNKNNFFSNYYLSKIKNVD
jgi:hypothetical protein